MSPGEADLRVVVMRMPTSRLTVFLVARLLVLAVVALHASVEAGRAATITITTSTDEQVTQNGNCTLREALAAAESNTVVDACPAGSAVDADIVLLRDDSHAWSAGHAFVAGGGPLVIRGPAPAQKGCYVIIQPPFALRFLRLLNGADVTIENCEIREGDASSDQSVAAGGAILVAGLSNVSLTLRNVVLTLNRARTGGAISFETSSTCVGCRLTIEGSYFTQNVARYDDGAYSVRGGALFLQLRGDTQGRIVDTVFDWNQARSNFAGNQPTGGGIYAGLSGAAALEIRRSGLYSNSAIAGVGASAWVGGLSAWPFGDGVLVMEDVYFDGNEVVGPAAGGWPATALEIKTGFSGSFALDRLSFYANDWSEDGVDVSLQHNSPSPASAHNLLVGAGARRGGQVENLSSGAIALSHWTVTQHVERGLFLGRSGVGEIRLDNSIVWNNGSEVVTSGGPTVDPGNNLIGVDPIFEAPGLGGFRLGALSPAIDSAEGARSGGPYDLDHHPRIVAAAPDAGAFERGGLFADGFESADTGAWSGTVP